MTRLYLGFVEGWCFWNNVSRVGSSPSPLHVVIDLTIGVELCSEQGLYSLLGRGVGGDWDGALLLQITVEAD